MPDFLLIWQGLLALYILIINLLALAVFGIDKARAQRNRWRVPEKSLFLLAFLGGSVGALGGMFLFHHKTRHWTFRLGIPAILLAQLLLVGLALWYL